MNENRNKKSNGRTDNQKCNNYYCEIIRAFFASRWKSFRTFVTENDKFIAAISTSCVATFTLMLFISNVVQWNIMRSSMILEQRAWIGITTLSVVQFEVGKPIITQIGFKNTGKTPAKKVTISSVGEAVKSDSPPYFTKEEKDGLEESKGIVTPQQEIGVIFNDSRQIPLSDIGFKGIISDIARLYMHGIVKYDDIFGHHHWITYCYRLEPDGKHFSAYKEHNDTDDN
jgi:hypothetical protein